MQGIHLLTRHLHLLNQEKKNAFCIEVRVKTNDSRQEHIWQVRGTKGPMWLDVNEQRYIWFCDAAAEMVKGHGFWLWQEAWDSFKENVEAISFKKQNCNGLKRGTIRNS